MACLDLAKVEFIADYMTRMMISLLSVLYCRGGRLAEPNEDASHCIRLCLLQTRAKLPNLGTDAAVATAATKPAAEPTTPKAWLGSVSEIHRIHLVLFGMQNSRIGHLVPAWQPLI
jgi:hypothetical protein